MLAAGAAPVGERDERGQGQAGDADDGPGIAPDVRDRLFERFARGDSSRERRTGSTGLGMSIALAIVQSHGGSIDVDSSTAPEDHGTTFSVRLPAAAVEE